MDENAINGLTRALKILESSGGSMDLDQVWNSCFPTSRIHNDTSTSQDVASGHMLLRAELKSSHRELKHLLDALGCLTNSLERRISSLEIDQDSLALCHFAHTAPAEILENIFHNVCLGDHQEALNLARVNKRFCHIIMSNPRFWNRIDNVDTSGSFKGLMVSLGRTKSAGLDIKLSFDDAKLDMSLGLLKHLAGDALRWEKAFYKMDAAEATNWKALFRSISCYSSNLSLPRLKEVTLNYPSANNLDGERDASVADHSEPSMHFYASWFLPNLKRLKVVNMFPIPFSGLAPPLTTLELVIYEGKTDFIPQRRVYNMSLLLDFLRSIPCLETLCMEFISLTSSTSDNNRTLPQTVLPNLRTLKFTALYLNPKDLLPFMRALCLPKLTELNAYVGVGVKAWRYGLNTWLDCILPHTSAHYENVETFSLRTQMPVDTKLHTDRSYDVPFERLPNLRCLTLETPRLFPNIFRRRDAGYSVRMRLPKLREVHFVECNLLGASMVRSFIDLLKEQNLWDALRKVSFTRCYQISEVLAGLIFDGKVVKWEGEWKKCYWNTEGPREFLID